MNIYEIPAINEITAIFKKTGFCLFVCLDQNSNKIVDPCFDV